MRRFIVFFDPITRVTIWTNSAKGDSPYFYSCPQALGDWGPFDSQEAINKHYNSILKTMLAPSYTLPEQVPLASKVVHVDFVAKKRMP